MKAFEPVAATEQRLNAPSGPAPEPPAPKAIENPGMDAVTRRAAAKARHEAKTKPDNGDSIPIDRTPYDEVCQRMAAIHPPLAEYWTLKAAKRLGWITEGPHRLADVNEKALRVFLARWTDLVKQARAEEQGIEGEAQSPAAA